MKNRSIYYLFFTLLLITAQYNSAKATHIYGGDLRYENIAPKRYKVILTIYGDCSGQNFPTLDSAFPTIEVRLNNALYTTLSLQKEAGSGKEVTPVCPDDSNNTACKKPGATIPGIARYIYVDTLFITAPSSGWSFVFTGRTGASSQAGRSNAIGNIDLTNANGSLMCLVATLNNLKGDNSSPSYTTIPTPFFCVSKTQEYDQGATDPDNDSLSFLLTPALETSMGGGLINVTYKSPYSSLAPIATTTGGFTYDNLTGKMTLTPNLAQVSLVDNKLEEYKNGVMVGSSMREMTFIVFSDCPNLAPAGKVDSNITGGAATPLNVVNVCQGTSRVAFTITPADPEGNTIFVTTNGTPFGGNLNVNNNNTKHPTIDFEWNLSSAQPLGTYTFNVNYKDDGCPLASNQSMAYAIKIVAPFTVDHAILAPTQCAHRAYAQINIKNGVNPKVVEIIKNGVVINTYIDSIHPESVPFVIQDSFTKGIYMLNVRSPYLNCSTSYMMPVVDSGVFPYPPYFKGRDVCLGDTVLPIVLLTDTTSFIIKWYSAEGSRLPSAPTYTTDVSKVFSWFITQTHLVCESEKAPYTVTVHDPPVAGIYSKSVKVCLADKVYLIGTGGYKYTWLPADKVVLEDNLNYYTVVKEPTTYTAIAQDEYGCKDSADITFSEIEQCCTFSYPNAFTPNGDGRNDGFHALLYGNTSDYLFMIYNRWGEQVFKTTDPLQAWDGNYKGRACDAGVYYYRVKGKCATGHEEQSSGDFVLLR